MFYPFKMDVKVIKELQRSSGATYNYDKDEEEKKRQSKLKADLAKYLMTTDGIIDGKSLKELWFPKGEYHIFLSHSSQDIDEARYLKYWFRTRCGLKCFIDADVWENAYELLRSIDNKFKAQGSTNYDYNVRNKTTAHVYSMLTMALFEAIDEIECPILIESENSVALDEGIKQGTLSPWIYEEVGFMGRLPHNIPERFLRQRTFSVGMESVMLNESVRDSVQMVHPLDTKGFKHIEKPDLTSMSLASGERALNILYKRRLLLKRTVL